MAINFSGEFNTPRSLEEVFDFLSDPGRFAPLLPDYQSMSMQDATHFTVKVKVGVGNIRGSAELKMELTEAVKPQRAQYKGQGTAVGSQVNVIAGFDLEPNGETTKVVWKGETSVFGKLASMAGGMLEPLGRKNIQKLIEGLQKALSEPLPAQPLAARSSASIAIPTNGEAKAVAGNSDLADIRPVDEKPQQAEASSTGVAPGFISPGSEPENGETPLTTNEPHGYDNA